MLKSIRSKLLIPILSVVLITGIGMGVVSYQAASTAVNEANSRDGLRSVHALRQLVDLVMDTTRFDNTGIASNPLLKKVLLEPDTAAEQLGILQDQMKELVARQPLYNSIIALNAKGTIIASTSGSNGKERGDREYFTSSMSGKFYISPPSTSKETKKTVIFFSVPVTDAESGKIIGVVMTSLQVEPFSARYVKPVRMLETGYALIVNKAGRYIAHNDEEKIASEGIDQEILRALNQQPTEASMIIHDVDGKAFMLFTEASPLTEWRAVVVCPKNEFYAQSRQMAMVNSGFAGTLVLLIGLISFFAVRQVTNDLSATIGFATSVAGGNLDSRLSLTRNDELGVLADALRSMVGTLKSMIGKAEAQTEEARQLSDRAAVAQQEAEEAKKAADLARKDGMHQAADRLKDIVGALSDATHAIKAQVAEASQGAFAQSKIASQAASSVHQMEDTVADVSHHAGDAAESSAQAKAKAEVGAGIVKNVISSITSLDQKTNQLQSSMGELAHRAEAIGQIMVVISTIADQTNLLALNAAIEAARAGDAGRGFAVVADEVRKLAESTMTATQEVGEAVKAIQAASHTNINEMAETSKAVAESTEMAQEAGAALAEIVSISDLSATLVASIAASSGRQKAASEQISHDTAEINSIASNTAALMQDANNTVSTITRLAESINTLMRDLKQS